MRSRGHSSPWPHICNHELRSVIVNPLSATNVWLRGLLVELEIMKPVARGVQVDMANNVI
jgi:hypothetical protein